MYTSSIPLSENIFLESFPLPISANTRVIGVVPNCLFNSKNAGSKYSFLSENTIDNETLLKPLS